MHPSTSFSWHTILDSDVDDDDDLQFTVC